MFLTFYEDLFMRLEACFASYVTSEAKKRAVISHRSFSYLFFVFVSTFFKRAEISFIITSTKIAITAITTRPT